MRTKRVILRVMQGNQLYGTFCNDPNYELNSSDKVDETLTVTLAEFDSDPGDRDVNPKNDLNPGECGCCSAYHRPGFMGDCREDDERFYPID